MGVMCTSESENANFRTHCPLEQIQTIAFSLEEEMIHSKCMPWARLTAALFKVLKLLLSNADFTHSALEPCLQF